MFYYKLIFPETYSHLHLHFHSKKAQAHTSAGKENPLDQQEDSKSSQEDSKSAADADGLKVPSLKIIVSGAGGHPYVKSQAACAETQSSADAAADSEVAGDEHRAPRADKKPRTAAADAAPTTPVKQSDCNVSDSPAGR